MHQNIGQQQMELSADAGYAQPEGPGILRCKTFGGAERLYQWNDNAEHYVWDIKRGWTAQPGAWAPVGEVEL